MSTFESLKKLILPAQSSGYSLSDFIVAYLDNAKQASLYNPQALEIAFGEILYKTEKPIYKSGFYKYEMLTIDGPKHVEKIEFTPKLITENDNKSSSPLSYSTNTHI
jgi:hypothetical protein